MPLHTSTLNPDPVRIQAIHELLSRLGMNPDQQAHIDYALYHQALIHSSYTYENKLSPLDNYERMEFLGDAVLKIIISEYLFECFPEYREGDLTKIRSVVVSDAVLSKIAKELNLGEYMIFGVSEKKSKGHLKPSNLACAFEAFLGALFLDGKMVFARQWLTGLLADIIDEVDSSDTKNNYKAVLQEYTQAQSGNLPQYHTVSESGPSHNRTFTIEVSIHGEILGRGQGKTKKEAQQNAAKVALEALEASS